MHTPPSAFHCPLCYYHSLLPFFCVASLSSWDSGCSYHDFSQHHHELHGWQLCIFKPGFARCSIWSHTLFFISSLSRLLPSVTHELQPKAGGAQCDLHLSSPVVLSFPLWVSCDQLWKSSYTMLCNELREGTHVFNVSNVEMFVRDIHPACCNLALQQYHGINETWPQVLNMSLSKYSTNVLWILLK